MTEFLAPLNYDRASEALRRLSPYTVYTHQGAQLALEVLRDCYPLVFSKMEQKPFANDAVLLELQGANITEPLVFTAHLDVRQTDPARKQQYAGELPLSVPLSRAHVVALLEALEELLRDGYRPGGDLFLALSMDGLSGGKGAKSMAGHLQARSLHPCFVLDYGGYATMEAFRTYLPPQAPLALIGIAEKGLLQGTITATADSRTDVCEPKALEKLMQGGARICRRPRRAALCAASTQMLQTIAKKTKGWHKLLISHPRLTFPLLRCRWRNRAVMRQFFLSERTLYAAHAEGTPASPAATASLCFTQTVIPGVKTGRMKQRLRRVLFDHDLQPETDVEYEYTRRSQIDGEAWDALETAIEIQFEQVVIAPCLCPYLTDSRFYTALGDRVYRFSPFLLTGEEALSSRCTVTDNALQTAVQFFRSMLSV